MAAGARAVLAPRGLGLRASAERASRGGALPPRPISGRRCRWGAGSRYEFRGGACDRKAELGVAVSLANRDERCGYGRVGLGAGKA